MRSIFVGASGRERFDAKVAGVEVLGQVSFGHSELTQVFERQIDSTFGVVDGNVLPEVRELQGGAGAIGKLLALGVVITTEVENEMAYGIGGIVAVGEHIVEGVETGDGLVPAKGEEEVGEFVLRDVERATVSASATKTGWRGAPAIAGVEFRLPLVEQRERGTRVSDFIAQVVGDAAVGVDVQEILAQFFRQEPGGDGEVFVVRAASGRQ